MRFSPLWLGLCSRVEAARVEGGLGAPSLTGKDGELSRGFPLKGAFLRWLISSEEANPGLLANALLSPSLIGVLVSLGIRISAPPSDSCLGWSARAREGAAMDPVKKPVVSNMGAWAMNVVSSVGIIMANKQLMSSGGYGFRFATTLTAFHFTVTALVGWVSKKAGYSASKQVPLWELLWFSVVADMSITAMNFSLMLNSVGFYQISKLSMIPVVCVMEWILHNKNYSPRVIMSVFFVAFGVGVCTVTDVEINVKGFLCACVAVLCTSLQQITIGSLQKKYNIGSFELLSKTAPIQAASLLLFGPMVDYYLSGHFLLNYQFSYGVIFFILLSCSLAVFCNMSQYICIGRFSAVSFQVLGHMKTVCVLILGWILFDSALTFKNIVGMMLAVLGMIIYSWAVETEKQTKAPLLPLKEDDQIEEEDVKLLKDGLNGVSDTKIELGQTKS